MTVAVDWEKLFHAAEKGRQRAYAPYSHFLVGAALLLEDGTFVEGCNVENASYGLSLCAERNAVGQAVSRGLVTLLAVAIFTDSPKPCPPCGMCRQVLSEFAGPALPVRCRTLKGDELRSTLGELLPHSFGKDVL